MQLGLRLGRHDDSVVDAYFGPPELAAAVQAEPPIPVLALVSQADALLDEVGDGWLRDQVAGLRTYAGKLAGQPYSYADEVHGCFGVRPTFTDESLFEAAYDDLAQLLPGTGTLADRYEKWRNSSLVPADRVADVIAAIVAAARVHTTELIALPPGETVEVAHVRDVPWNAYNYYLGDLRGRIEVNLDLSTSAMDLLRVALHEGYPGHQAERALKEHLLVRGRGLIEETLVLTPTPQSMIAEGIAELAVEVLLDSPAGPDLAAVIHDAGVTFDLAEALAIERATQPYRWVEVNAALLLHERGATEAEAIAYLQQWGPLSAEMATHVVRFISEPASRIYILTYPAGARLCRGYVAGQPDRFRRLLTEQVRIRELADAAGDADSRGQSRSE